VVRWLTEAKYFATLALSGERRHALPWLRSLSRGYLLDAPSPWINFEAIAAIRARLAPGMRVFEYGSGGSTLYWASCGAELVSVEHDPEWYEVVRGRLRPGARVDLRLVEPEPYDPRADGLDPTDPLAYTSSDAPFRGRTFRRYVTQIDAFPDGWFDLVLVDGRARPSCLRHAAPKVKPGGMLVLDNADRELYLARTGDTLGPFRRETHVGVGPLNPFRWRTDVYLKP
jgi:hypothetical protein